MKANFKTLCVVSFLFLAVGVAVFVGSEQNSPERFDTGPLTRNEMTTIRGGGEGGCSFSSTNCNQSSANIHCIAGNVSPGQTSTRYRYYGGVYNTPYALNNPTSEVAPKEDGTPPCFATYTCVAGAYHYYSTCSGANGCVNTGSHVSGCTDLQCSLVGISDASVGRCVDP